MSIQKKISRAKKKALIGREFDLLLKGPSDESDLLLEGRTAMHAPEIDGKVFVNDYPEGYEPQNGEFYRCRITEAHDYDLVAEIFTNEPREEVGAELSPQILIPSKRPCPALPGSACDTLQWSIPESPMPRKRAAQTSMSDLQESRRRARTPTSLSAANAAA